MKSIFARMAVTAAVACSFSQAYAASIAPPSAQLKLEAVASGVQVYDCEFGPEHQLSWVFKSPRATLYDASGRAVIEHSAGPTWQATDGSRITGQVVTQTPSDAPGSIPQLLLQAKSNGGDGLLADVRFIQRVQTSGGVKPSAACTEEHQIGSSPYIAIYRFYR